MIFDIAMKLARKSLSKGLYNKLSYDFLGRRSGYERIETYAGIYNHYREKGITFRGKTVIEVGTGLQYFTALYFLSDGASRVYLVEPKLQFSKDVLRQFLKEFNLNSGRNIKETDLAGRIHCYSDLSQIPTELNASAELLCSYTVLEHVSDLPGFFSHSARLLQAGGRAYHMIDLSDHTYQVFARFRFLAGLNGKRALFHLRYSRPFFGWLNDPKCYMNRVLMPQYLDFAKNSGFEIKQTETSPFKGQVKIHPDLLYGHPEDVDSLHITTLSLLLERPGNPSHLISAKIDSAIY